MNNWRRAATVIAVKAATICEVEVGIRLIRVECQHSAVVFILRIEVQFLPKSITEPPGIPVLLSKGRTLHLSWTSSPALEVACLEILWTSHVIFAGIEPALTIGATDWNSHYCTGSRFEVLKHGLTLVEACLTLRV